MILEMALAALTNFILLFVIPLTAYSVYQQRRNKRPIAVVLERVGLRLGDPRYVGYAALAAAAIVAYLLIRPPALEPFLRDGSAQARFAGLGIGTSALAMAVLYGVIQTGFCEEFLFRGLIAGSLARRLGERWGNLLQAVIFLLPHLILLSVMPEMWPVLVLVFVLGLFAGWLRIRSGSIVGPWILHAAVNVTMALSIAHRSVS